VELAAGAQRRSLAARGQRRGEHAPERTAPHDDGEARAATGVAAARRLSSCLVPGLARPAGQLERGRSRGRHDLELLARRHPLERRRQQHLEPAAELELLGVEPAHQPR
jgi:hypothetical protein